MEKEVNAALPYMSNYFMIFQSSAGVILVMSIEYENQCSSF